MKFLTDQDVYATTVRFLSGLGHDVVPVAQLGLSQADDAELLRVAHKQDRLFVTRDRDFGNLVFVHGSGAGVLYLRILPSTQRAVHAELANVLTLYSEQGLRGAFVVIELGRHRLRKPAQGQGPAAP
jgi:predicted nuclease of predicted toxin-antitoxin system